MQLIFNLKTMKIDNTIFVQVKRLFYFAKQMFTAYTVDIYE